MPATKNYNLEDSRSQGILIVTEAFPWTLSGSPPIVLRREDVGIISLGSIKLEVTNDTIDPVSAMKLTLRQS